MTLWIEIDIFPVIKYSVISVVLGFFLKGSHFTNFLFPWVFKLLPILTYNLKTTFHPSQLKAGSSAACDISLLSGGGGRRHRPPNGTLCSPTGTSGVNQRPTARHYRAGFSSASRFLRQLIIHLSHRCPVLPAVHKVFTACLLPKPALKFLVQQTT